MIVKIQLENIIHREIGMDKVPYIETMAFIDISQVEHVRASFDEEGDPEKGICLVHLKSGLSLTVVEDPSIIANRVSDHISGFISYCNIKKCNSPTHGQEIHCLSHLKKEVSDFLFKEEE